MFRRSRFLGAFCRRKTLFTIFWCCIIISVLLIIIKLEQAFNGAFETLNLPATTEDLQSYVPIYEQIHEDFPSEGELRIEKRIHQTWKSTKLATKVSGWVKSWLKYHPDYEYYLWTDESARKLIAERYPHLLDMFDNYKNGIRRADALRYIILYEFGGVYADLDMESLKSLKPLFRKYSCFLAQEPYEHPILQSNFKHLAINAFMACSKDHPFMKMAVDNLPLYSHMWQIVDTAGPHFLTSIYKRYTRETDLPTTHNEGVYLGPPEYFFPEVDPHKYIIFYVFCNYMYNDLTAMQKQACIHLKRNGVRKKPADVSFTTHHWTRTYAPIKLPTKGVVDIHDVVPSVIIY